MYVFIISLLISSTYAVTFTSYSEYACEGTSQVHELDVDVCYIYPLGSAELLASIIITNGNNFLWSGFGTILCYSYGYNCTAISNCVYLGYINGICQSPFVDKGGYAVGGINPVHPYAKSWIVTGVSDASVLGVNFLFLLACLL